MKVADLTMGILWVVVLTGLSGCSRDAEQPAEAPPVVISDPTLWDTMLEEEDARGASVSGIEALRAGMIALDPALQRTAVRAIGRLEDPELVPLTFPLLFSNDESVRAEAINAVGQAAYHAPGDEAAEVLFDFLAREPQEGPVVRAVIGRTLGRLLYNEEGGLRRAEETILGLTREGDGDAPLVALTGAVMGLESMARRLTRYGMSEATVERLHELAALGRADAATDPARLGDAARVRRVSMMALLAIGEVASDVVEGAISDPDPDVRRLSVMAIGRGPEDEGLTQLLLDALSDPSPRVRVEAVRAFALKAEGARECPLLFSASRDEDLHVVLTALDLLQQTCENPTRQEELLSGFAAGLASAGRLDWHRGAHALVSLATVAPELAAPFADEAVGSANPLVRVYAAEAMARMGNIGALEALAEDVSPNVRTAAMQALFGLVAHGADGVLLAQLDQDDPQLLLIASQLLEGTRDAGAAAGPLLSAFQRISQERRETARDPRMALLDRIAELGNRAQEVELEPYLNDYDPMVAARVAEILTGWTSESRTPQSAPLQRQPLPPSEGVQRLAVTRVVLEMARGGEIEIRLLPNEAPIHSARFERLAAEGYFDGLTFHRVVSNFVIQGGSPGSNEYVGASAYTRDEVGLVSHWRGTVATSTRGRDTGDGQIFINLVDNLGLDHEYTVFGVVVSGMDVVDQVAEGDLITRARIVGTAP